MKSYLNKIQKIIVKNIEFFLLFTLTIFAIFSTHIYNINKAKTIRNFIALTDNIYFQKNLGHFFDNLKPKYQPIEHIVSKGESFYSILRNYKISEKEIKKINSTLLKIQNLNKLKINQVIKFTIDQSKDKKIIYLLYPVSKTKKIEITRDLKNDNFLEKEIVTNLNKRIVVKEGIITHSLYKTAENLKIPINLIVEFARIYGFQVDFQRDIRKNDSFQIMYEIFEDENKKIFETGNIIFADLILRDQSNSLYYFEDKKKDGGHYDVNGKSVKKALMKTPINGARLSSSFGMRKHPIDGFNKMHRGTDFAAPKGTPIMASGDGVIVRAKWCGGGGNCIKIKHNTTYSTVYAHMSKFASGMTVGRRVKQGQVIGYVGSTGKSTGPHLHYEVIENGKKINSQTLKLPSGKILKGKNRKLFEVNRIKLDVLKSELILGLK
tara:strand:+ start:154 stop:1461 length:1308 start_codon:yes stop_codon:yes gene_type:complete